MIQHRLVVIGSRDENVSLIRMAKERGYYVIVCDGYDKKDVEQIADKTYDIDVRDVDKIANMCIAEKADGIIGSFSDVVFEQITCIAEKAGLKWYATPEMLDYYRDKFKQKELLSNLGISVPKYAIINKKQYTGKQIDLSFPIVVKPVNGWGSRNIVVLNSLEELDTYMQDVKDDIIYEVEEYCEAYEYNCISWVLDGKVNILGISDRERNPQKGNKVATLNRIVYPSKNYDKVKEKAHATLQKFIEKTGQKQGPISMQFFFKEGEICVCEIAGRVLGHEHDLISYCGGVDVKELLLDYVYPESSKSIYKIAEIGENHIAAGIYFLCKENAVMSDISKVVPLFEKCNVRDYEIFGEKGCKYTSKYPYFAKCYFDGDTRQSIDAITKTLYESIYVGNEKGENIIIPFFIENGR